MLVRDLMTRSVVSCTPWDTARTAARLMKQHDVGAIVVVANTSDPLLEGIITDRDLCCGVMASGESSDTVKVVGLMTSVPITCGLEDTLYECVRLMQEAKVRRIPIVDDRARCVGIVTLADIALHASPGQCTTVLREISSPGRPLEPTHPEKDFFYCGQTHEADQILLLKRRRELARKPEVLT